MSDRYSLKDINPISYEEYGTYITKITGEIKSYCTNHKKQIDIVAPILRGGGVLGTIIAVQLGVTKMLPLQFKYDYKSRTVKQTLSIPEILSPVPKHPTILICDGNTSSGRTAAHAAKILKKEFPTATLLYATVTQVYDPEAFIVPEVEHFFYGVYTNDNGILDKREAMNKGVRYGISIFPWEKPDDQLQDINEYFSQKSY